MLDGNNLYQWQRDIHVYLAAKGLGATFQAIRAVTGLDEDVGGTATTYEKQVKRLAQHNRVAAASIIVASVGTARQHLLVLGADGAFQPEVAYDAVTALCLGTEGASRGEDIDDALVAITAIPDTGADGETIDPQSDAGVAELFRRVVDVRLRATIHAKACADKSVDNEYPISEKRIMNQVIRILIGDNTDYRSYRPAWRECKTIDALRTMVLADRREVTRDTDAGAGATRAFMTHDAVAALTAKVEALTNQVTILQQGNRHHGSGGGGGGGGGGGNGRRYTDAELERVGVPPDTDSKWIWCPHHLKWGTHTVTKCRKPAQDQ